MPNQRVNEGMTKLWNICNLHIHFQTASAFIKLYTRLLYGAYRDDVVTYVSVDCTCIFEYTKVEVVCILFYLDQVKITNICKPLKKSLLFQFHVEHSGREPFDVDLSLLPLI